MSGSAVCTPNRIIGQVSGTAGEVAHAVQCGKIDIVIGLVGNVVQSPNPDYAATVPSGATATEGW